MDTSETYIKMCEKAEEIRKDWLGNPTRGDYYIAFHNDRCVAGIAAIWSGNEEGILRLAQQNKYCIWLPRQDQLQEIVEELFFDYVGIDDHKEPDQIGMINAFSEFAEKQPRLQYTMEQLWLAFVMKERYGKTWNGEEWIKSA